MQQSHTEQQLYQKIELLTSELERSSDVLQERSIESESWKIQALTVEHRLNEVVSSNNLLNQQFVDLSELLKVKVIEVEETRSKLNRIQQITLKEQDLKIQQLMTEIQSQNQLIQSKVIEQDTNRQQTIAKIQELQEERQKGFHFENYIKQLTSEKLQALHYLKLKQSELDQANLQIKDLSQYKAQSQTLILDLDNVRKNYQSLYEQHVQEVSSHNQKVETLRQVNQNNLIIMSQQYADQLIQEKTSLDLEKNEKLYTAVVQLENRIQTLTQINETKEMEIAQIKLSFTNEIQENQSIKNLEMASQLRLMQDQIVKYEIQSKEYQQILERNNNLIMQGEQYSNQMQIQYKEQLQVLDVFAQKYQQVNIALQQSEAKRIENDNKLKVLNQEAQTKQDFIQQLHTQLGDVRTYQIRIAELENSQQISKNREFSFDQLQAQAVSERKNESNEADQKIKYLLRLLEQRELQIQEFLNPQAASQPPRKLNLRQQQEIYDRRKSMSQTEMNKDLNISNMFYHQADEEFQQGQSRY